MKQKGFTLIELMIVVAIIGILAAIAIPQYNKYVARTQVTEAFVYMAPIKQALILYHQENGQFPTMVGVDDRHDALGIAHRDGFGADYIRRITVRTNGGIRVFFNDTTASELIRDKLFELRPTVSSGAIVSWTCFSNTPIGNWIDQEYIQSCN